MENLSAVNTKCLTDMPTLLDSVSQTLTKLVIILSPYYDTLKKELNLAEYSITNKCEQGYIYILGDYKKCKSQYSNIDNIFPSMELRYRLPFEKLDGEGNLLKFEIIFGYLCDDNQNVIYFQLFEMSEKSKIFFDDFLDKLKQSVSDEWEKWMWKDGYSNMICVQFSIDEFLSAEKIDDLFNVFKEYILLPAMDEVEQKLL